MQRWSGKCASSTDRCLAGCALARTRALETARVGMGAHRVLSPQGTGQSTPFLGLLEKCSLNSVSCVRAIGRLVLCDVRFSSRMSHQSCGVQLGWEMREQCTRRPAVLCGRRSRQLRNKHQTQGWQRQLQRQGKPQVRWWTRSRCST